MFRSYPTAKQTLAFIFLLLITSSAALAGKEISTDINWKQRFDYWTKRHQTRFQEPAIGRDITIKLRNGQTITGTLAAIHSNNIAVLNAQAITNIYTRTAINRAGRMLLFKDDFARANALQQVLQEKQQFTNQSPGPSPETIQTQANLLTEIQFTEYAETISGHIVRFCGIISDVKMNFFDESQCYLKLTEDEKTPVIATFTVNAQSAPNLNRNEYLTVTGIIKSLRLYTSEIRITLNDVSMGLPVTRALKQ